jgi:hypothetical protein
MNKGAKTNIQDTMLNPFLQIHPKTYVHTKTNAMFINKLIEFAPWYILKIINIVSSTIYNFAGVQS